MSEIYEYSVIIADNRRHWQYMKRRGRFWIFSFIILILSVGTMLLFSSTTSPLYPNNYGVDSAFFRFVGLMIRRGKTLYSEIWDNKGPLLFFLQAVGTLLGTKNADLTLTFLMQTAGLFLTIWFLFRAKIAAVPDKRVNYFSIFPLMCGMAVFCKLMEGGNLCEEWSILSIACSLFLLVKYASNVEDQPLHPRRYAFLHGVCLAFSFFIRANNVLTICSGLSVVGLYLIFRRKWQNLFENLLFGILGFAVICIPIILYFLSKHALDDMFYSTIFYNFKYSARRSHETFAGMEFLDRYLPIGVSILILLIHVIRERRVRLIDTIMIGITAVNAVSLWQTNQFLHYFVIFVPVLMLALFLYADFPKIPEMLLALVLLIFFVHEDIPLLSDLPGAASEPDIFAYAASIPDEEKDPAMVLYATPAVYLNSGLIPCSRFAAYHFGHFPVEPAMKDEFLEDMHARQPYWIVYLSGYEGIIPEVKEMLDTDYEKAHEEYGLSYYHLKRQ